MKRNTRRNTFDIAENLENRKQLFTNANDEFFRIKYNVQKILSSLSKQTFFRIIFWPEDFIIRAHKVWTSRGFKTPGEVI